jgi:hypothetical protein
MVTICFLISNLICEVVFLLEWVDDDGGVREEKEEEREVI